MDRRCLFVDGVGSDWNTFRASADGVDRNAGALAISFTPKMEGTRLADAAINSDYWYFVVVTGLIVDLLIYGTTRFL